MAAADALKACAQCGTQSGKLLKCAGCDGPSYCGAACQAAAWPAHKDACVAARSEKKVDIKSVAKKLIKFRLSQDSMRDVKKTGKLLQAGFAAGCRDNPKVALLAVRAMEHACHAYLVAEPGASADDLRPFVKAVLPDLIHCGLQNFDKEGGNEFCQKVVACLMVMNQGHKVPVEARKDINFTNEARRSGVLRLCAEVMRHHRGASGRHVQVMSALWLYHFCQSPSGRDGFDEMVAGQAHKHGLRECLDYALKNCLDGTGFDGNIETLWNYMHRFESGINVQIPRSALEEAKRSGNFVALPNVPEIVLRRMGVPCGPGAPRITDHHVSRYVEHSQDPDAIQYLNDKKAALEKFNSMSRQDKEPNLDQDGYDYSVSGRADEDDTESLAKLMKAAANMKCN